MGTRDRSQSEILDVVEVNNGKSMVVGTLGFARQLPCCLASLYWQECRMQLWD
jgi:hypothetical protein